MSLQTLSDIMNLLTNKEQKFNRPEKGGSFRRAGKKEGVWGRNFCLPAFLSFGFARCFFTRRPRGGGRRGHKHRVLPNFSWRLASMLLFEIGSNFVIQAAPNRKSRFLARNLEAVFQAASHLLPREPEVRLRRAQSSVQWYDNFTIATEQPIFCISPKAKLLNFQKESDNFPRVARLCPKVITT